MPLIHQFLFELDIVFDNSVVNDNDFLFAADMGMRIRLAGASMRGPARVPQS
jgi:hypothetical protein